MPFIVIKGTFHVVGYSPDGDSIRFKAHNRSNWNELEGSGLEINAREHVQLRIEGIDTLETHYTVSGGPPVHQPLDLAEAALMFLLEKLDIRDVEWNEQHTRVVSAQDGTPGFIVSRAREEHGRPVAFIFSGDIDHPDGESIFLDVELMRQSLNYQSLEAGWAYPTYYRSLFFDLRNDMTAAVTRARQAELGVWARDRTNDGVTVTSLQSITEDQIILPKLFRRLSTFIGHSGDVSAETLAQFPDFLANRPERVLILSQGHTTHLDTVIEVQDQQVRMTKPPEDLVFDG